MMDNDIVIEHHLRSLGTEAASLHIAHVYCEAGECEVCYNDRCIPFLAVALQGLFLDFHDFHARIHGFADVPVQAASLLARFFSMLEGGACRTHREVAYFASELCVVPKHLSDTCYKLSGFSALYWIKRFTLQEIKHLLRDKSLTIAQIADIMDFSSAAHFNRYVRQNLGITPMEYRK